MFVKNCWYCAAWDYEISQGRDALIARTLAGEPLVLYRKPDGEVVAMEDRCCHRQAPLSLGAKEGEALRCGYHGMLFGPDGVCREIPGQTVIPPRARVRTFPVVEKDNWVWVWMGDPALADPQHICYAVGPGNPDFNIRTSKLSVNTNYRYEIANLTDLSHIAWVHAATLSVADAWTRARPERTDLDRGFRTTLWMENSPPIKAAEHLFPDGAVFDAWACIDFTLPCNFVLNYQVWTPGSANAGKDNGTLLLDTWTSQAVTPRDEHWVDYYYSWGVSKATDSPGMSDLLLEIVDAAFLEDKAILEGQYARIRERPDGNLVDIKQDLGPNRMFAILDRFLAAEAGPAAVAAEQSAG